MTRAWLTDPSGAISAVLELCRTVDDAAGLLAFHRQAGPLVQGSFLGSNELAVLLALDLEARSGVDVAERYAAYGELGAEFTEHGPRILEAAARPPDPTWRDRLSAAGIAFANIDPNSPTELTPLPYGVDIGRDFS